MTEEEAKKKMCPMTYVAGEDLQKNPAFTYYCLASDCMMWRWEDLIEQSATGERIVLISDEDGYCGLAGKP